MNIHTITHALDAAFARVCETSVQATVLILLVLLFQFAFRRPLTPRWRYVLGLLILVRLALPVVPRSPLSIFNLGNRAPSRTAVHTEAAPFILPSTTSVVLKPADLPPLTLQPVATPRSTVAVILSCTKYLWLAGVVGMLALVARQHRRLTSQVRAQEPINDPRVLQLLEQCQAELGMKRKIEVLATTQLSTPALFGNLNPRLLVPAEMLGQLEDRELRLVFLHELTHLKRGDILTNWLMILLRALHWFNPFVWLAMKRLRADQEMACDAAVMSRLPAEEGRLYGNTLIKLVDNFAAAGLCPGLAPFITNQHVIKRRITMISKFKPAGPAAPLIALALIVVLGCVAFTRAAETQSVATKADPTLSTLQTKTSESSGGAAEADSRILNDLKKELEEQDQEIKYQQEKVNALRRDLNISSDMAEGGGVSQSDGATRRRYQEVSVDSDIELIKQQQLLNDLKKLDRDQLRQTLPRVVPDNLLTTLLQDYFAAQNTFVSLQGDHGGDHPDVVRTKALIRQLNREIDDQVTGITNAMQTRLDALQAVLKNSRERMKYATELETEQSVKQQPYFQARADLERLQKFRAVLMMRLFDEQTHSDQASTVSVSAVEALVTLAIEKDGTLHLGGDPKPITLDELKKRLHDEVARHPHLKLLLRADQGASYDQVTKVLDVAQEAKVHTMTLQTAAPEKP